MIAFMLNYRQNIFMQTVAVFLVWILVLASAGFHGHLPADARECTDCAGAIHSTCDCCENETDCGQQSDNDDDQPQHKCHCFCFGNLLTILHGLEIQNILLKQPFYMLEFQINIPLVIQNIFQPPKY